MPDQKISQLASGTNAQTGDLFVIARSGANYSLTTAQLFNAPSATATLAALTVDTDTLFVDATNNRVGVGTASPSNRLTIANGTIGITDGFNIGSIDASTGMFVSGNVVAWQTASTTKMRLDSAGNLGIGVTPGAWDSTYKVLQIGSHASFNAWADLVSVASNIRTSSGNAIYLNNGEASQYLQYLGTHRFLSAASGTAGATATVVERMRLDINGNLGLSVTPSSWGGGFRVLNIVGYSFLAANGSLNTQYGTNARFDGTNWFYEISGFATRYEQLLGAHSWHTAPSGTAGNAITFTQAMTLDAGGRLLVGASTARSNFFNASNQSPRLQVESAGNGMNSSVALVSAGNGAFNEPNLIFAKSRGNTVGDNTIVQNGDDLGNISFQGSDGTEFVPAAGIFAEADGAPAANNMPGRLLFLTTASGSASPVERWRINSSGHLLAGADNTYDIGASGATRPRDVFIGGTFTGSKMSVSGVQDAINAVFTQNGESALINLRNATGGTAAVAGMFLGTDASTATLAVRAYSSAFTTSGLAIADSVRLSANRPGGLTLQAADAAGVIRMAAGGTTERVRVKAEGQVRYIPLAAAPTTNVEDGDVYYDSGTNKLRVRAGGAWVDLH